MRFAPSRRWVIRGLTAIVGALALGILLIVFVYMSVELPSEPPRAQSTVLIDANGKEIASLFKAEDRVDVPLNELADVMEQAVVAAEDRHFYEHSGLDPIGITRAFVNDVRGKALQGGSTITQQLVKNAYLSPERSIVRKGKEAVLATKVEQKLSKKQILERYLNTIYFGRSSYGVEIASRNYFGKPAAELRLPEAALLAGAIRSPERSEPEKFPEVAKRRRDGVLDAMAEMGTITKPEAEQAKAEPIQVIPRKEAAPVARTGGKAYFVEEVRKFLVNKYGERVAYSSGMRVQTTLDATMQDAAERASREILNEPDDPEVAIITLDNAGGIKAMVAGRDFNVSKVNLALGKEGGGGGRQPGSTFKPLVLAAAVEENLPVQTKFPAPASIILDTPQGPWEVHNYGDKGFGDLNLIDGTVDSVNTVYAQLINQITPEKVVSTGSALGLTSKVQPLPSVALGSTEVSPLEMTRSYLTLANRGQRVDPYYVTRIEDASGKEIYKAPEEKLRVMDEGKADLVNHILQQVAERGTAKAARIGRPIAAKTGTTQDYGDAWLIGYTPNLATGVWMGYPEGQSRPMTNVHGKQVTGGSFPSQIWKRYMSEAVKGTKVERFVKPSDELLNAQPIAPTTLPAPTSSTAQTTTIPPSTASTNPSRATSSTTSRTTAPATTTTSLVTLTTDKGKGP